MVIIFTRGKLSNSQQIATIFTKPVQAFKHEAGHFPEWPAYGGMYGP